MGNAQIFELERELNSMQYKSRVTNWKLLLEQQQRLKWGQQHENIYHRIKPPINLTKANRNAATPTRSE